MVQRLTGTAAARRSLAFAALVGAVVVVHGCVARGIAERITLLNVAAAMPARIEVAYVREMTAAAPPPVAAVPAAAPPKRRPRAPREAQSVAAPASTPEVLAALPVETVPEPPLVPALMPMPPALPEPAGAEMAAPAADAAASAASAPAPFAWPSSTRLRYLLTGNYRGEINGNAQVEWVRQGERYQAHVDVTVGLPFAPLMTRRMSSEGRLGADGLTPERYDEDSKVAFRDRRRLTMRFEPDAVVMPDGRRLERLAGVQDTASQFIQMTWMFTTRPELLTAGGTVELPLALPRNIDRWVYDVLEPETLYTPFGAVETFHLRPRRAARAGSDLTAEVWFAPSYRYLPVRIRIRQDADTFIDLMVDRPPQLAE